MRVDLEGRVALVTGAARGIGQAIADTLAANGAKTIYSDCDLKGAQAAASRTEGGEAVELDVRDEGQVEGVVAAICRLHGKIDILVNNAGINTMAHRVTIDEFPLDEWQRILDVDLTGLYRVSKAVTARMKKQSWGRIVNIASVAGIVPLRLQCAFTAAKAGVVNLTKAMALEIGREGVTVNAVAPGSILTEGTRQLFYGDDGSFRSSVEMLLAHIPLGRPGSVEEIAHAVLFLASPDASYVNGAILTVDGGWTAGYAREF